MAWIAGSRVSGWVEGRGSGQGSRGVIGWESDGVRLGSQIRVRGSDHDQCGATVTRPALFRLSGASDGAQAWVRLSPLASTSDSD
eukprot:1026448-Rhodomonas_salina.2